MESFCKNSAFWSEEKKEKKKSQENITTEKDNIKILV